MNTIPIISPVDGAALGQVTAASAEEVDNAVQRALRASNTWGQTPVKERVQPLYRFKQLVESNIRELHGPAAEEKG